MRRIHESLLAPAEKSLLIALARAMPRWVSPDLLTACGLGGAALCFAGYLLSNHAADFLWLANLGLLLHWFGDSLDGTLARVRGEERPRYGFVVDQTVDVIGDLLILAGLGLSAYARLDTALLSLVAYHALAIHSLAWCAVNGEHRISGSLIGPTELRLGLVGINVALWAVGAPPGFLGFEALTWCDGVLLANAAIMLLLFIAAIFTSARALRGERPPGPDQRS